MRIITIILEISDRIRDIATRYRYLCYFSLLCIVLHAGGVRFCYSTHNLHTTGAYLYTFCHANIFHLAINLYALWRFRPRPYTFLVSLAVATVIPLFSALDTPTCGASAMIVAAYSRNYVAWHRSWTRILLLNACLLAFHYVIIGTEMMYFNGIAHVMAFSIGYIYWTIHYKIISLWKEN